MEYARYPNDDAYQEMERKKRTASALGAQSFHRLLLVAEGREDEIGLRVSGNDAAAVAAFISDLAGDIAFHFVDLRCLKHDLDEDIIRCIDAIRWAKQDLYNSVPDGFIRSCEVVKVWAKELRQRRYAVKVIERQD